MRELLSHESAVVEVLDFRASCPMGSGVLISCEHASNDFPSPYTWSEQDAQFRDTHWAWDPGAREISVEIAQRLGSLLVMPKFSRLILDANRLLTANSLFRQECDGVELDVNKGAGVEEQYNRIQRFHVPYYFVLGMAAKEIRPWFSLSIHTFNPIYCGAVRDVQVGVLHEDPETNVAEFIRQRFEGEGYDARLNEPWSGRDGLMPATSGCACSELGVRKLGIEMEFRNDLATNPESRARLVEIMVRLVQDIRNRFVKAEEPNLTNE